jgi:hypothetical protein
MRIKSVVSLGANSCGNDPKLLPDRRLHLAKETHRPLWRMMGAGCWSGHLVWFQKGDDPHGSAVTAAAAISNGEFRISAQFRDCACAYSES